jgi:hypothetical protein
MNVAEYGHLLNIIRFSDSGKCSDTIIITYFMWTLIPNFRFENKFSIWHWNLTKAFLCGTSEIVEYSLYSLIKAVLFLFNLYSDPYWPIVPAPGDCEDGELGGMNGRGNRSTRRKPAPAPLYSPQIPLDQTRDWTRAAAVGSQRLTASAMARPKAVLSLISLMNRCGMHIPNKIAHRRPFCVTYYILLLNVILLNSLTHLCTKNLALMENLIHNSIENCTTLRCLSPVLPPLLH